MNDIIYLLYDARVRHLTGAASNRFFLDNCNRSYWYGDGHRCAAKFSMCFCVLPCLSDVNLIQCNDCNQDFLGQACFENHKNNGS